MLPDINLPVTTALAVKDKEGYKKGLRYGANVIMPNMSVNKFKELYKIYPGKGNVDTDIGIRLDRIKRLIIDEGREIGKCKGNRITKKF
jgi:biotin synthase